MTWLFIYVFLFAFITHSLLPAKGFRGLYRGLGANLIGVTPEKAIKVCPLQLQLLFPRKPFPVFGMHVICYCAKLTCDGVNLCQLAVNERLREAFEKPDGSIALHHEVRSTVRHLVVTIFCLHSVSCSSLPPDEQLFQSCRSFLKD